MDLTKKAELAIHGDKEAFVNVIRAVQQSLYVVARSIVKNDEDCADAIQETVVKAFSNVHRLKEPAYFKTWIIRILINECNWIIRKKKRVYPVPYDLRKTSHKSDYEQIELLEVICGSISQRLTRRSVGYSNSALIYRPTSNALSAGSRKESSINFFAPKMTLTSSLITNFL
ncbi:RNA polymerase sigma-70 factor (ECF subfamily) [Paenibacillus polymyxa]|uniref:sigma factor n=1 Tax=Paenibacillus polymyxa TaxID=1406 RepID=UPI002793517E|nr:sigma factor [Paenibacillus polymyxa]MDQ0048176.1 RNA polymerase sigma-70 factor (ECF subfamily) [Paenibacillus polymyxa]